MIDSMFHLHLSVLEKVLRPIIVYLLSGLVSSAFRKTGVGATQSL